MRYKRVLLVLPAFKSDAGSSRPSPTIGYLAQALEVHNICYDVLDMKLGYSFQDLIYKVDRFCPDLVGFTIFTLQHQAVYKIIEKLKGLRPNIHVIVGGPHISAVKEKALQMCNAIDFACCGEGDDLLVELCSGEEFSSVKGLAYNENGKIFFTGSRPHEANLDRFNFPKLKKFELEKYTDEILIISSRGCPYGCIYCSVHLFSGKKIRVRSVYSVVDEIEYWHRRGKRILNFADDNFTFYADRVYQVCDEIERRGLSDLTLRCSGVRADRLNKELLKRMKAVGFKGIGIGVEAGNNKVLNLLKKGETVEEIEEAIKNACDLGYEVILYFLFGTPGETEEDIEDSIKLALKYPVFKAEFYNPVPFPGTELYDWVTKHNAWTGNPSVLLNEADKIARFGSSPFFTTKELPLEKRLVLNRKIEKVMSQVMLKSIQKLFEPLMGRLLSSLLSRILLSTSILQLYYNNNSFRKLADYFRYKLLPNKEFIR